MTRYARIENATVVEIIKTDGDIAEMFHPSLQFVAAGDDADIGWLLDGGELAPPPPPPAPSVADLLAYAADHRWRVETAGLDVGGVQVYTDDRSKMMIMGARIKAGADPDFTTDWKTAAGEFVTIDAATVIAISDAILDHVAACFAAEAGVIADIEAGDITTIKQIDQADWP